MFFFFLICLQVFPFSVWTLWTKGSARPPSLGFTTTRPPRRARSSHTRAAAGAATTSCRGKAAWTCALKVSAVETWDRVRLESEKSWEVITPVWDVWKEKKKKKEQTYLPDLHSKPYIWLLSQTQRTPDKTYLLFVSSSNVTEAKLTSFCFFFFLSFQEPKSRKLRGKFASWDEIETNPSSFCRRSRPVCVLTWTSPSWNWRCLLMPKDDKVVFL